MLKLVYETSGGLSMENEKKSVKSNMMQLVISVVDMLKFVFEISEGLLISSGKRFVKSNMM